MTTLTDRVLRATEKCQDLIRWRIDPDTDQVVFYVSTVGLFFWDIDVWKGYNEVEILPDNINILEDSVADVEVGQDSYTAPYLFAARVRKMRPLEALYKSSDSKHLFDACGPKRDDYFP